MASELLVLGVGNMGGAIVRSVLNKKLLDDYRITLIEPNAECVTDLIKEENVTHLGSIDELPESYSANTLLTAIKPQLASELLPGTKDYISENTLIISIMAGYSTSALKGIYGDNASIIRVMPNLPFLIGKGATLLFKTDPVPADECEFARAIFSGSGSVLEVENERLIDAGTAMSGSGPGYLFYLMQGAIEAACELGFSEEAAKQLLVDTIEGGAELYAQSEKSLETLEAEVTSKGGTTEAGLSVMKEGDLKQQIKKGIKRAFERAEELANG